MPHKANFAQERAADNAALLSDIIDAGGLVNIRLNKKDGARLAIRFDAITSSKATQLFIRYRAADTATLHKAACALLTAELEGNV